MPETVVMQQPDSVQAGFRNMFDSEPLADEYLEFLVKELKPFIDKQYRTKTDASHTFIMGSSMGGLISMYALAEFPEVFGGAGCLSTHWPIGNGACVDYWADHLPEPGSNRIYFDYGTATLDSLYEPYQVRVDQIMQDAGYTPDIDWITRKYEGDDHSERSWNRRVHVPLTFFLKVEE
jgi:predicted alpha/beta superfamily hydrolase